MFSSSQGHFPELLFQLCFLHPLLLCLPLVHPQPHILEKRNSHFMQLHSRAGLVCFYLIAHCNLWLWHTVVSWLTADGSKLTWANQWLFANFIRVFQSIRSWLERFSFECREAVSKTKTNPDSLARVFPRFATASCNYLEFWLVHWIVCVLCDWLE